MGAGEGGDIKGITPINSSDKYLLAPTADLALCLGPDPHFGGNDRSCFQQRAGMGRDTDIDPRIRHVPTYYRHGKCQDVKGQDVYQQVPWVS